MQICCFPDHRVSNQKASSGGTQSTNFSSSESFNFSSVLFVPLDLTIQKFHCCHPVIKDTFFLFFFFFFFCILGLTKFSVEKNSAIVCSSVLAALNSRSFLTQFSQVTLVMKAWISDETVQAKHVMWVYVIWLLVHVKVCA